MLMREERLSIRQMPWRAEQMGIIPIEAQVSTE